LELRLRKRDGSYRWFLVASAVAVVLRTRSDPAAIMGLVCHAVAEIHPCEVVYSIQTMDEILSDSLAPRRLSMILFGVFAALALVLACVGIYGVISYLVGQCTNEIGVRIAVGAQRSDVLRMVLGHRARMAVLGVTIGVAAALAQSLMSRLLFGVSVADPLTFTAVAALLTFVALAALHPSPPRHARRPIVALRHE
jgi:predicted lysophospholipase L1 biosynthesis ABC-type transport system permease subunit